MYQIRDAAKRLNVETVDIHKKLISLKRELSPYIKKENGITKISEEGIDIISLSLAGKLEKTDENNIVNTRKVIENIYDDTPPELKNANSEEESGIAQNFDNLDNSEKYRKLGAMINEKKNSLSNLNHELAVELERNKHYIGVLESLQIEIMNLVNQ